MTPSHSEGLAAAKRVQAANEMGEVCGVEDQLTMLTYHLSMVLRLVPENRRNNVAGSVCTQIRANTRESLD